MLDADILTKTQDWETTDVYICAECGREFAYFRKRTYCSQECRRAGRQRPTGSAAHPTKPKPSIAMTREGTSTKQYFIILKDKLPVNDGGFRPGAILPSVEIAEMIRSKTLADGSILWNVADETLYVVDYSRG